MDVRERLDDVERELKKGGGGAGGQAASDDIEGIKKDLDYVMGRDGTTSEISGIPSLVSA